MNKVKSIVLSGLVVLAIVLGYAIYQQKSSHEKPAMTQNPSASKNPSNRLSDEAKVLNISSFSTEEEKKQNYALAVSISKEADFLDIANCTGSPVVLRLREGTSLKVRNKDSVAHSISFNDKQIYPVLAGSTIEVKDAFAKGPGLYGYGCDNFSGAKGMVYVVPK